MPQVRYTNSWLQSIKPDPAKGIWYSEAGSKGLLLYVGTTGKKTWYINYRRLGDRKKYQHKIGDADLFSVSQARDATLKFLASVKQGETPWEKPEAPTEKLSLGTFIRDSYGPWVLEHRKAGKASLSLIQSAFARFLDLPVDTISVEVIEQWRSKKRQDKGLKASSLNRQITALRAALNWGVKRGIIEANNMTQLERLREDDSDTKVRYLSQKEQERLDAALDAREERMKAERDNHNAWLAERNEPLLSDLKECAFVDYLKPMVITTLNTGIRRGSLFQLLWSDINFQEGILTVRPAIVKGGVKGGKIIHIPMNATLTNTLTAWKEQTGRDDNDLIFPSPKTGGVMDNCRKAWANLLKEANIENFRWHDMRHDFASQLVMKGVDLNTVRELLGHADMKMTLRYAHLAPQVKRAAVEMLDSEARKK